MVHVCNYPIKPLKKNHKHNLAMNRPPNDSQLCLWWSQQQQQREKEQIQCEKKQINFSDTKNKKVQMLIFIRLDDANGIFAGLNISCLLMVLGSFLYASSCYYSLFSRIASVGLWRQIDKEQQKNVWCARKWQLEHVHSLSLWTINKTNTNEMCYWETNHQTNVN